MAGIHRKKSKSFLRRFISFIMTLVIIGAVISAAGVLYARDKQTMTFPITGISSYSELIQEI